MYVRSLELTNFRNFRRASIELADAPLLIVGENGQGKSNLLEAIELLATAKSARAGLDRELVNWGALSGGDGPLVEAFARIRAAVVSERREQRAEIVIRQLERPATGPATGDTNPAVAKTFRLNGVPKRALEFVGTVKIVAFSPLDVAMVDGPPSGRRRYLDVMNAQINPSYLRALQRYLKVLAQRNHLLRDMRSRGDRNDASLEVWSEQLISQGSFLIAERAHAVDLLTRRADDWFHELAGSGGTLEIGYRPALGAPSLSVPTEGGDAAAAQVRELFTAELARLRPRELAAGMSLAGPHRDDLRFLLGGVDLQVYGSRGQQRLAALALKLAEADHVGERAGTRPVILMDDVLSELDRKRQDAVLRYVERGGQTLLTLTSRGAIPPGLLSNAAVVQVSDGSLEQ